jgi:ribosome biogenesis GTPase
VRSLGGFYTVISEDGTKTECRGRGIFRRDATTLLVGDRCRFEPTEPGCGSITAIAPRKNTLAAAGGQPGPAGDGGITGRPGPQRTGH